MNLRQAKPIVPEVFPQGAHTYAGIYHQPVVVGIQKIAVSTASTAKGYESQHVLFQNFLQRYCKSETPQNKLIYFIQLSQLWSQCQN